MTKRAIIYVRVSTDEQAEKGYSLSHQEERIRMYCQHQNIEIVGFYKEDHSAKTFNRPAFIQLLAFLKKRKAADLLLFLKWDRFSRNAGDAYGMINQLSRLGVEPQAIEQPLDLSVPENKIMLAFYLAAPEVENDRRSLNTIAGMRRALKEGRYCTTAPRGYRNTRDENNKPIIVPGNHAKIVQWIFESVGNRLHSPRDVWRLAAKKGFKINRNNIYYLLRNPIYMGRIIVPAYKDEDVKLVRGIHEPLVSEKLFYDVQYVLNGKKRTMPTVCKAKEELPLRNFLKCPECGRNLSGSASSGNGGKYFYYHCFSPCKVRFKAEIVNEKFLDALDTITANDQVVRLYEKILGLAPSTAEEKGSGKGAVEALIEKHQHRIANAQQLMLDGEISAADYRAIKSRYEPEIQNLQQTQVQNAEANKSVTKHWRGAMKLLKYLRYYYEKAALPVKQMLIGSIISEKMVFEKNNYRTIPWVNVIPLICRPGAGFGEKEKGLTSKFRSQPYRCPRKGSNLGPAD